MLKGSPQGNLGKVNYKKIKLPKPAFKKHLLFQVDCIYLPSGCKNSLYYNLILSAYRNYFIYYLMNFKKNLAFIAFSIIICSSCKNTIDIQAPYKDITVVYGLMDQNDPIHYIRINKAFEGSGNAYTMAKQYDSIYYPVTAINAVLQDSDPVNDVVVKTIPLDTTTTVPLGPGTFLYPKQLLYYTKATLNPNDYYNLIVTNAKTGKKIHGSTAMLQDIAFTQPTNMANRNQAFDLGSDPYPSSVEWNSTTSAVIYQMVLQFYYHSRVGNGPAVPQTPLQLVFATQTAPSNLGGYQMLYSISCQQLFELITSSLQPAVNVTRHADSLSITFTTGTDDFNTYIQLSQPSTGINQSVPSYSDVVNGVGLYTARHVQTYYKPIDNSTIDSIQGTSQEPQFARLGFSSQ
jgi:hypothetical protein